MASNRHDKDDPDALHQPFQQALQGLKVRKSKADALSRVLKTSGPSADAGPSRQVRPSATAKSGLDQDANLFSQAMSGVDPLKGSGRDLPKVSPPAEAPPLEFCDPGDELRRLVDGQIEFDLEFSDEFMEGHVRGLDDKIVRQLRAGVFSVEANLDLHGCKADQALDAVHFFMRESYLMGRRCVLLVPGRGRNSPGGQSILKQEIQGWLTRDPLRRVVLAFCTAKGRDGGTGALYVLLRKRRKNEGKVNFEKTDFLRD